jgi:hypothetical protein
MKIPSPELRKAGVRCPEEGKDSFTLSASYFPRSRETDTVCLGERERSEQRTPLWSLTPDLPQNPSIRWDF